MHRQSPCAYNYGAREKERITKTITLGTLLAVAIMLVGVILFEFIPGPLLSMFNASEEMYRIGIPALRIIAIHFPFAALTITFISVFQALGRGIICMVISFVRQLIILLPAAWLLSLSGNVDNIWWAFIIAELVALAISFGGLKSINQKELKEL